MSDPITPPPADTADSIAAPPLPPRKKRRWPKILLGLVVLLILFVVLLPTLVSLSPVRSIVVGQAQSYLNGKLEVDSWSFGWLSGTRIDGVKIYDKAGTLVAEADHIDTGLSLIDLARQKFDLGHTVIDVNLTKLVVTKNGSINYLDLLSPGKPKEHAATKTKSEKAGEPIDVPNVKGDIELRLRGAVQLVDDAGKTVDVQLRQGSGGTIKIADINQGISPDLKLIYDVNGKSPSEIDIAGDVDVIDNNELDVATLLTTLSAKVKLALKDVDLGAAQPVLVMLGKADTTIAGMANGEIDADLQPGKPGSAKGEIVLTKFAFAGPQIADAYSADAIHVPINITRSVADGKTRDTLDIKAILPEATIAIAGDVPEQAILNLQNKAAPGDTGWLSVTTTADPAKAAASLPKTLHVLPGVKINGGQIVSKVDVAIQPDGLVTKTQTNISITGVSTKDNVALSIPPINISTNATLAQFGLANVDPLTAYVQSKLDYPAVPGNISIVLTSEFAGFSAGGDTLTHLQGKGSADLDKLRTQLAQFFNLGEIKFAGQADFALKSNTTGNAMALNVAANVNKLILSLPGKPAIDLPFIKAVADASGALPGNDPSAMSISKLTATLLAGTDPAKPLLDTAFSAENIDVKTSKIGGFKVDHFTVSDVPELQKRFIDPFSAVLKNQQFTIDKGRINFAAAGSADKAAGAYSLTQCDVSIQNVVLKNQKGQSYTFDKPVTLSLAGSAKGSPMLDQIDVRTLTGDFGVATLGMPQPISVTHLSTAAVPSGQIELTGAIEKIAPLLQVIQSADAALPYKGLFKFRQSVSTKADDITLRGDGTIDNFEADDATGDASFAEKQVTIANDLTANLKTHHAAVNNFSLEMTASQAAKITVAGSIANWDTARTIEGSGLVATIKYDAAKLWPIIYAKMSPDQQKSYADAKVVGAFEKKFTVTGSYPVAKTMGESIKPLKADGSIELTQFTAGGIDLQQLLLNIALNKGVVTLSQQPAKINDGTLSLDKVQVDLTQADLRLFTPKNLQLVSKASINPALGDTLGKYVNPTFANSKQAKGLLSVTVNECKSLALSPATLQSNQSGTASITINVEDMDIASPTGSLMFAPVIQAFNKDYDGGADTFQGEIKDGKVTVNKGVATSNIVMMLSKPAQLTDPATGKTTTVPKGMPLGFAGDIVLKDLKENIKVTVPAAFIASISGVAEKNVTDVIPNGLTIVLKGTATAPVPNVDLNQITQGLIKSKLLGDDKNGIGDLLKGLGKKKKKSSDGD